MQKKGEIVLIKFETGKKYYCRSSSDADYIFEVTERTEKTVMVKNASGKIKRRKIYFDGPEQEYIYPEGQSKGQHSCLILYSKQEWKQEAAQDTTEKTQYIEQNKMKTQDIAKNEKMNFDKKEFLQSDFGKLLKGYVDYWKTSLKEKNKEHEKVFTSKWTIFQMAIQHCYGIKFDIQKDAYSMGIATRDKKQWLFQFTRPGIIDQPPYDNADQRCECWKCELRNICKFVEKGQRLPKKHAPAGGLGLCHKLPPKEV